MDRAHACIRRVGLVAGLAGVGISLRWAATGVLDQASRVDLESMAVLVVATAAWTAYGWLVLAVVATLVAQLPGVLGRSASVVAARITSRASHQLLRSALGLAAAAPLTVGVAHAAPTDHSGGTPIHSAHQPGPPRPNWAPIEHPSMINLTEPRPAGADRIAIPDRPTVGTPTRYAEIRQVNPSRHQPNAQSPIRVVVRSGDSLWTIAAKELGPSAGNATIARRWREWYAANARVIGDDPDLLLPGQVLRGPNRTTSRINDPQGSIEQQDTQENRP